MKNQSITYLVGLFVMNVVSQALLVVYLVNH